MVTLHACLYRLSIPFNLTFSHAEASRSACDSYILEVDYSGSKGYGELILRPYVNDPGGVLDTQEKIISRLYFMLHEVIGGNPNMKRLIEKVMDPQWDKHDLPLLAAVETAVLDLLCRKKNIDIYGLLGLSPRRNELFYGGIVPILSDSTMIKILNTYREMCIPYIRIKLAKEYGYNDLVLKTARNILGDDFDIRVDVNCAWDMESTLSHINMLNTYGVTLVEEPMGANHKKMKILTGKTKGRDIFYVADESIVSFDDMDQIIKDNTFVMLNLRIAKNGGLLRVLELSERAEKAYLKYQLGSHVGETGILSVMGRHAGSLMKNPKYIDGSFDDYILSYNITEKSYTFGKGGIAPIISGKNIGYRVNTKKLGKESILF
jgi:L-alanine-DL-glutamate epimerase-like enolase superfamily enzyme